MIVTKAVIEFNTHTAVVCVDDSATISIFKYNVELQSCDYSIFTESEQFEASDYILTPVQPTQYYVRFGSEIPLHKQ